YQRETAALGKVRASVTLGLDHSRQVGVERASDAKIDARVSMAKPVLSGGALLRAGLDVMLDRYDVTPFKEALVPCDDDSDACAEEQLKAAFRALFKSRWDLAAGGFVDALIPLDARSTL